jgi:hypothetical protein
VKGEWDVKCKKCGQKYGEHGSMGLGCPIYGEDGQLVGFSHVDSFEPEGKGWRGGLRQPDAN